MDYQNGKIYQILNFIDDNVYVGSTCQSLSKRFAVHKQNMNAVQKKDRQLYAKMREYGAEEFYIELIEEFPCDNIEQLRKREGHFIRDIGTLNHLIAGRTKKEWTDENIEHMKEVKHLYYQNNKEYIDERNKEYTKAHMSEIKQYRSEYYQANKEKASMQQKQRYEKNKEAIRQQQTEYRAKNKEQINKKAKAYNEANREKILEWKRAQHTCECGGSYNNSGKARHIKSQHHQTFIQTQNLL
jgi:hypothetical protein